MILTNTGKKFVYSAIIMMFLSMVLPWESLEDYTYTESSGIFLNIIPAIAFACAVVSVVLNISINKVFPFLCLVISVLFYLSEPFYITILGLSLILNYIIAIIFILLAIVSFFKSFSLFLSESGTNYAFLLICLVNGFVLYIGMQYYPDTYTIGYFLFPSSVVVFMLGVIYSTNRIDGTTGN